MTLAPPPPMPTNPAVALWRDLQMERGRRFPPGDTGLSVKRTRAMLHDPLSVLLPAYERYGPVFTLRVFHGNVVFMLGPEANHYMLVSHAQNFLWREGHFQSLIPLLGDGLLTIDGDFHRRSRKAMLPMFHSERIARANDVIAEEVERALEPWRPGDHVELYRWTRELALRVAMRALFGLDPDRASHQVDAATEFEHALGYFSREYHLQIVRGPGTPYARMMAARKRLDRVIYAEIDRRRRSGERGDDLLSLLLDARDDEGGALTDRHVRDEVMTLLFAGHDTTTSTVSFLFHELAKQPQLAGTELDLLLDETLRMYPPAWIGPRLAVKPFEFAGRQVPGGVYVNYCSWASHHLPDVWGDPDVFRPQRFAPGQREQIPKGAYVPFGGGSRTCIGMRFGQAEVKVIAGKILERFRLEQQPGYRLRIRQMPTIGPRDGMPMIVHAA